MITGLKITRDRGGNFHPICTRDFIVEYLTANGEATIPQIHGAYKNALRELAANNHRRRYHWARYASFKTQVLRLLHEGIVELSEREQESNSPLFEGWEVKPSLKIYRLS